MIRILDHKTPFKPTSHSSALSMSHKYNLIQFTGAVFYLSKLLIKKLKIENGSSKSRFTDHRRWKTIPCLLSGIDSWESSFENFVYYWNEPKRPFIHLHTRTHVLRPIIARLITLWRAWQQAALLLVQVFGIEPIIFLFLWAYRVFNQSLAVTSYYSVPFRSRLREKFNRVHRLTALA